MSKRRALMMALRKVVGGGKQTEETLLNRQRKSMGAEAVGGVNRRLPSDGDRATLRASTRTNASPISVVDNEFAPVRRTRIANRALDALRNGTATPADLRGLRLQAEANGLTKADMALLARAERG